MLFKGKHLVQVLLSNVNKHLIVASYNIFLWVYFPKRKAKTVKICLTTTSTDFHFTSLYGDRLIHFDCTPLYVPTVRPYCFSRYTTVRCYRRPLYITAWSYWHPLCITAVHENHIMRRESDIFHYRLYLTFIIFLL